MLKMFLLHFFLSALPLNLLLNDSMIFRAAYKLFIHFRSFSGNYHIITRTWQYLMINSHNFLPFAILPWKSTIFMESLGMFLLLSNLLVHLFYISFDFESIFTKWKINFFLNNKKKLFEKANPERRWRATMVCFGKTNFFATNDIYWLYSRLASEKEKKLQKTCFGRVFHTKIRRKTGKFCRWTLLKTNSAKRRSLISCMTALFFLSFCAAFHWINFGFQINCAICIFNTSLDWCFNHCDSISISK